MKKFSLLMGGICMAAAALAQTWPNQPIKLVVPYPPAGATDVVAREIAEKVGSANGWTFVVDNKPGAGGNIGIDAVVKSKPDGYTLAVGQTSNLAINPTLYPKVPYDALKDITPIAFITQQPVVVVVKADSPFKTLDDLVKAGKSKNDLTMASAATGTVGHLAGELFARKAGFKFSHIPYKGAGPALTDLMGGQTDFMLPTPQAALQLIQAGKLRALAVTSAKRVPVLPNVPTVAESGYPGFEAVDWKVLVGPAKMPPTLVKRLHDEVEKALAKPEMQSKLQAEGSAPVTGTSEQLEGPCFDLQGNLYLTDIPHGLIFRVSPSGDWQEVAHTGGWPNGIAIHKDGSLWVADYRRGLLRVNPQSGVVEVLLGHRNSESFKGINDLVFDKDGNCYFTDQGQTGMHNPTGAVYRLRTNGQLDQVLANAPSPNGIALDTSERFLFVAVTRGNAVWRGPLLPDGSVSKVGVFRSFFGTSGPDGMAVDSENRLVVAHASLGGAFVMNPRGEVTHFVRSPVGQTITNVAFVPGTSKLVLTDSEQGHVLTADLPSTGAPLFSHT